MYSCSYARTVSSLFSDTTGCMQAVVRSVTLPVACKVLFVQNMADDRLAQGDVAAVHFIDTSQPIRIKLQVRHFINTSRPIKVKFFIHGTSQAIKVKFHDRQYLLLLEYRSVMVYVLFASLKRVV